VTCPSPRSTQRSPEPQLARVSRWLMDPERSRGVGAKAATRRRCRGRGGRCVEVTSA
jgi:hypothetical protein